MLTVVGENAVLMIFSQNVVAKSKSVRTKTMSLKLKFIEDDDEGGHDQLHKE